MKTIKNVKKTFIAVSMVAFAAMMFSCAGTNKNAPAAKEAAQVQEQLDNAEVPAAPAESQNAAQNENPAAVQEENSQSGEIPAPAAE